MDQLLVARFVQGLGGGGLGALSMAVVADVVPARQLGRWMGYQGVIYAVSSVSGPLVGGLFVDHLSWRWAFLVNLPVGAVSMAIVATRLRVPYRRIPHALDWPGAVLLASGLACLVLVTTPRRAASCRGPPSAWSAWWSAAIALAALFVRRERRAPEPLLPLGLLRDPIMRVSVVINFTSGMLLWCGIFFVPLYVQEVRGASPTRAGLVLVPLMFGAAAGTLVAGRRVERSGRYRRWPITGSVLALAGIGAPGHAGRRHPDRPGRRLRPGAGDRRGPDHAALAARRPEQRPAARPRHGDVDRAAVPLPRQRGGHPHLRRPSSTPAWPGGPPPLPPSPT